MDHIGRLSHRQGLGLQILLLVMAFLLQALNGDAALLVEASLEEHSLLSPVERSKMDGGELAVELCAEEAGATAEKVGPLTGGEGDAGVQHIWAGARQKGEKGSEASMRAKEVLTDWGEGEAEQRAIRRGGGGTRSGHRQQLQGETPHRTQLEYRTLAEENVQKDVLSTNGRDGQVPEVTGGGGPLLALSNSAKADAKMLIHAAFSTEIVFNRLSYLCDTFGPRFSGTTALEAAIDHIKAEMLGDNLTVFEEPTMIPRWVRGNEWARLVFPRTKRLAMVGLGNSVRTPGIEGQPLRAPVLVVRSFADLEAKHERAKGCIVVFNAPYVTYSKTVAYRVWGAGAAAAYGAVAVLVRSIAPYGLQTPHAGTTEPATIPAAAITLEDAELLQRLQDRGQQPEVELYMEAEQHPDVPSRNLIVQVTGSERPAEVVVIGGHIDSWDVADGAIDDGGGALVSWEAVRLIHQLGLQPRRTVRAVLFVNEENGARGGQRYWADHRDELQRTSIAIESDQGTFTPYGLQFTGSQEALQILQQIGVEILAGIGAGNVTAVGPWLQGTDVGFGCRSGIPCAAFVVLDPRAVDLPNNPCRGFGPQSPAQDFQQSAYFWYHHTTSDTIDKVSPHQLQHSAASMAAWAYAIAELPDLLPR